MLPIDRTKHALFLAGGVLVLTVCAVAVPRARQTLQQPAMSSAKPADAPALPPLSYTCPMHPEVMKDEKGNCPICNMELVPIRLDTIWSCPVHSVVHETKGGKCPICRRDLVQVTMALSFTCEDDPSVDQIEPGVCKDGAPTVPKHSVRAHGNHNPQHGGQFYMAEDAWHHIEGTYPEEGLLRVHLYDDYTKPLSPDKVKEISGRVVLKQEFDSATKTTKELVVFPLKVNPSGQYLEARITPLSLPSEVVLKMKFGETMREQPFDLNFMAYTKEPALDAATAAMTGNVDPSQIPIEIPDNVTEVMTQLTTRNQQIKEIIDRGAFTDVYVPALQAKDLALALDLHAQQLPGDKRRLVPPAIKRLVLAAWLLDAYGDLGNRQLITDAYKSFSSAVTELQTVFPARP